VVSVFIYVIRSRFILILFFTHQLMDEKLRKNVIFWAFTNYKH